MNSTYSELQQIQNLVLDIMKVGRNHRIPGTDRRENVIEHSFSVAMLSWKLYTELNPPLRLEKILKYALVHDYNERGQEVDVNTYASDKERAEKRLRENLEIEKIIREFKNFEELVSIIKDYEDQKDEESKFVRTVDQLQQLVLGELDSWRPYKIANVTYKQFCDKQEAVIASSPECLKETYRIIYGQARNTYYDRP